MADWVVSVENFRHVQCDVPDGIINDGAPADGRTPITGELVRSFLNGDMEAARAIAVNPATYETDYQCRTPMPE